MCVTVGVNTSLGRCSGLPRESLHSFKYRGGRGCPISGYSFKYREKKRVEGVSQQWIHSFKYRMWGIPSNRYTLSSVEYGSYPSTGYTLSSIEYGSYPRNGYTRSNTVCACYISKTVLNVVSHVLLIKSITPLNEELFF